jgi:hypothetical protein
MSGPVFVAVLVAISLVFTVLDAADRHLTRQSRYSGERLRAGTLLFLLAALLVYAALQYGGFALVPGLAALTEQVRGGLSRWCGRPPDDRPMDGA